MKRILALVALALVLVVSGGVLAQDDTMTYTVELGGDAELGPFLVGADGMTLYIFTNDTPGLSNCYDQCATNWPPLLVEDGEVPTQGAGVSGELGVITRTDSTRQVTYNGWPLYYWVNDAAPGDTTGHEVGGVWFVAKLPALNIAESEEHGPILVGANGMTLYLFLNDTAGLSVCYDQCAVNWPPLLVAAGEEVEAAAGIDGDIAIIERTDGTYQVSYNGQPLYYWIQDSVPGDTTGDSVGDVWYVVVP